MRAKLVSPLLAVVVFLICLPVHAQQINKSQIIDRAKRGYYDLADLGFISCEARVVPNWRVSVKDIDQNPDALRLLNSLRFSTNFDTKEMKVNQVKRKETIKDHN